MAAVIRSMALAVAAVSLVQATEIHLPSCLSPFQPFVYSGCYQEVDGTHILPYRSDASSDTMTVESCVAECKGNGYRYAGLVYYGNCYCGQTVIGPQVDEAQCNYPCKGNSSEICGANNIFSVYQDPTFGATDGTVADYASLGCWDDDSSLGRAVSYRQDQVDGATLTTEGCLAACKAGNFPFAGTEYGGECYCGVVIGNDTYAAPAEECDMPCNGNSAQSCGGRNRLNLYVDNKLKSLQPCGYVPPVSSTTTSTTTTSTSTSQTSTAPACTSTVVTPPTCEYKCGKWCSTPLPDWADATNCKTAWSNCAVQVASCFKNAGWPDVLNCFDFGDWCGDVSSYCNTKPGSNGCRKSDFFGKKPPPKGGNSGTTTVVTTTCAPTTTAKATTTTKASTTTTPTQCPILNPTNICTQASNWLWGYAPGKPVGGIAMPIVTCNDLAADWPNYPFKGYSDPDSKKCRKYARNGCTNACTDACKDQYEDCVDVYAEGCRTKPKGRRDYFDYAKASSAEKRTLSWLDSYNVAVDKCKAQYSDCLSANRLSTGSGKCSKYGAW